MQVKLEKGKKSQSLESLSSLPTPASAPGFLSRAVCLESLHELLGKLAVAGNPECDLGMGVWSGTE